MFLLGAVLEIALEFLFTILIEVGVPGTGHVLAFVATGGWAYRGGRGVGDALASVIGVLFWLAVAGVIAFFLWK